MRLSPSEFRALAIEQIDAVHRLACHLALRPEEADDLVQETYLRALKSSSDFELNDFGVKPYLFKILHNVFNSRLAHDRRRASRLDDLGEDAAIAQTDGNDPHTQIAELDWDHVDERLKEAVDELPVPQRTVFLLCAVEDLRYREIADIVQVPVGTVMSRLYHARKALAGRLAELAAEMRLGNARNQPANESKDPM